MEGEEDDPYRALVKFCLPTSSQELKLESCPLAREFEAFPDAVDSLGSPFSPGTTQSSPPGIVMVSLPDSEDEDLPTDATAPLENEDFQTPPEEQILSPSSSQGGTQRNLEPTPTDDPNVETGRVAIEGEIGEDEPGVENLGFSELGEMSGGEGRVLEADCLERADEASVGLKEIGASEGESEEPALKKIRVKEEIRDSTEVERSSEKVDDGDDELIDFDTDESDDGLGIDEDMILSAWNSAEESDDNEVSSNSGGEDIPNCDNNRALEVENTTDGGSHSGGSSNSAEEEEGIHLGTGDNSASRNGDLDVEELEEGLRDNGDGDLREYGKEVLNSMNREDIDAFKYNGNVSSDDSNQRWKEVMTRRRKLPHSVRVKSHERDGWIDAAIPDFKNLSPKKLLDALAVLLKVSPNDSDDVDFLETAKRRGMTFPKPRWL